MFDRVAPTVEYCEKAIDFVVRRPFYAVSNLAFILVGIFILKTGGKRTITKFFGYSSISLGTASLLYDISYLYFFQLIDLSIMFVFVSILIYKNLSLLTQVKKVVLKVASILLLLFSFAFIIYSKSYVQNVIFAFYSATAIITLVLLLGMNHVSKKFLISFLSLFFLGFIFWCLDFFNIYCDPTNILNGRSAFHILAAMSIYKLYLVYNSQKVNKQ